MTPPGTRGTARLGVEGERAAERHLRRIGHRLIARNVRLLGGELDLVMRAPDRRTIVVVEVKARVEAEDGRRPEANVTAAKRAQLVRLTRGLLAAEGWGDRPARIDVVAVEFARFPRRSWIGSMLDRMRGHRPVAALRHLPAAVDGNGVRGSRRGTRG